MLHNFPRSAVLAAFAATALFCAPATAQDLNATVSCLHGTVAANDYSLLDQKLREAGWERKGGVTLQTDISNVGLQVLDAEGQSVCDQTANNSTSCAFRLDLGTIDVFTVRVDNELNSESTGFKVCAY